MPDPDLEMGGGGGSPKIIFSVPWASFWSKNKGGEEAGPPGFATGGDFRGGPEVTRFQVVSFAISANFGFNLSMKVHARENQFKNGEFLVGF